MDDAGRRVRERMRHRAEVVGKVEDAFNDGDAFYDAVTEILDGASLEDKATMLAARTGINRLTLVPLLEESVKDRIAEMDGDEYLALEVEKWS